MPDVIEKVTEDKKINIVDTHIVFQGNSGKSFKISICWTVSAKVDTYFFSPSDWLPNT